MAGASPTRTGHTWRYRLVGTATAGDGICLTPRAPEAGCVAGAAGGRAVGAGLTRCVRLTHGGSALGCTVTTRRARITRC
eukprot:1871973-Prymnesium_polylepis.1